MAKTLMKKPKAPKYKDRRMYIHPRVSETTVKRLHTLGVDINFLIENTLEDVAGSTICRCCGNFLKPRKLEGM